MAATTREMALTDEFCVDCGYQPELKRTLGSFQMFAISFASGASTCPSQSQHWCGVGRTVGCDRVLADDRSSTDHDGLILGRLWRSRWTANEARRFRRTGQQWVLPRQ